MALLRCLIVVSLLIIISASLFQAAADRGGGRSRRKGNILFCNRAFGGYMAYLQEEEKKQGTSWWKNVPLVEVVVESSIERTVGIENLMDLALEDDVPPLG